TRAVEPLRGMIESEDPAVRADAALALARIAPTQAVRPLIQLAKAPAAAEEAIAALRHGLSECSKALSSEDLQNLVQEISGYKAALVKTADPAPLVAAARSELTRRGANA